MHAPDNAGQDADQKDPTPAPRLSPLQEKRPDPARPKLVLRNLVAFFPNVYEPRDYNGLRYDIALGWTAGGPHLPEHLAFEQQLEQVGAQVLATKFPGGHGALVRSGADRTAEGFAGRNYVSAYVRANKGRPSVFDSNQNPLTVQSGLLLRGGCIVNAIVSPWAWKDERGATGLSLNLHAVQYVGEWEEYAGGELDQDELVAGFGAAPAPVAPPAGIAPLAPGTAPPAAYQPMAPAQPAPAAAPAQPAPAQPAAAPAQPGTPSWA